MTSTKFALTAFVSVWLTLSVAHASDAASERESLETLRQTTLNLIQALVDNGILSKDKADDLVRKARQSARATVAQAAPETAKVVRVPYVPQIVRDQIKAELRAEVMDQARAEGWAAPDVVPAWVDRIKGYADVRVRYQFDQFDTNNLTPDQLGLQRAAFDEDPIFLSNSQEDRRRWRTRLRFGAEAKLSDWSALGFGLATGNGEDPVSTNTTQGDNFNGYGVAVDQAYIRLDPVDWFSLEGGRFANPFFSTDLVWDSDLRFDGLVAMAKPRFSDALAGRMTLGVFPVDHVDPGVLNSAGSKWLYAAQAMLDWKTEASRARVGLAYYHFQDIHGVPNTAACQPNASNQCTNPDAVQYNATEAGFRQKGNSIFNIVTADDPNRLANARYGLASKFQELNLTGSLDLAFFDPVHVVLTADYVKNLGFDRQEIKRRTGRDLAPRTEGYMAQLLVGYPRIERFGQWNVTGAYKYLERDAVIDAFTDSDFRLGGTDARGYILGGSLGLYNNTWLSARWLSADPIDGPPLSVDVFQLDLNARF